jgi:CHAT domain-containing protein
VAWEEIQKTLNTSEAAVEFIKFSKPETKQTFYAALILKAGLEYPEFVNLFNEKELSDFISREIYPAEKYVKTVYTTNLSDLIWRPLEPYLNNINTIYYSPEGMLHRISFSGLPIGGSRFLSDKYDLRYVSSTRNLVFNEKQNTVNLKNVALFGGIDYEGTHDEQEIPLASSGAIDSMDWNPNRGWDMVQDSSRSVRFNFLKYTEIEVEEIEDKLKKRGISCQTFQQKEANESLFKSLGEKTFSPEIIHLGTHGFFFSDPSDMDTSTAETSIRDWLRKSDNPLFRSGLALSESNLAWEHGIFRPDKEDGILTAYEIAQMNLTNTNLVVLSACQSGLGDVRGSEGVYGLQRAFKMAGVDYLLLTLWNIRDGEETVEFMTTFYGYILSGNSIRSAFRMTQNQMRERYKDPYFWAGFILID